MDIRAIIMGLSFALIWSSAFTSARIIVQDAPPMWALSIRFLLSGLIAIIIAKMLGQNWHLSRRQWRDTVIFGVCQNALYLGLFFVAMQWIEAGLAAIIASSLPLIVALLSRVFLGEKTSIIGTIGLLAGFSGVALIMSGRLIGGSEPLGFLICGIGVLALAIATLVMRSATSGGNMMMVIGLQMLIGSVVLFVPAIALEEFTVNWSLRLILAFVYTTLVPGLAATWIWFQLVHRIGSVRAATYHFLNPFFGVAIAAVLLGELVSLRDFIGVGIIMAGILAVQLSRRPS